MRIAVVGATGATGRLAVGEALARGHLVRALVRRPAAARAVLPGEAELASADVLEGTGLDDALAGVDAVVSALGVGTSRAPTEVYSRGTARLLDAMALHRVARLVVVSAAPAGPHDGQPWPTRRLVMPVLARLFGETYADMRRMEARLAREDAANWLVLRPPRLVDGPPTGAYRIAATPPPRGGKITRADLASALLDAGERGAPSRTALFVAN